MATVTYQQHQLKLHPGETVLDGFIRQGVSHPFSCRSGICGTCLLRREQGEIPPEAQAGLSDELVAQDHLLPCRCVPAGDLTLIPAAASDTQLTATVVGTSLLGQDVIQVLLDPAEPFAYQAGQFLRLQPPGQKQVRCYSLASVPGLDSYLELQVRRVPGGQISTWLHDVLQPGDQVAIGAAQGTCHYQADSPDDPLLLIGTGIGLTPMIGILRDALFVRQHRGPIYLYHGSRYPEGLYWLTELLALARQFPQVHYYPCVSGERRPPVFWGERASDLALRHHPELSDFRLFICGREAVVCDTRAQALAAGLPEAHCFADIIYTGAAVAEAKPNPYEHGGEHFGFPAPDPEMWTALEEGEKLRAILEDFYEKVYEDPKLAPFFVHATRERAIQKQYSFLYQVFTGKPVYLGESPRNAHHWMVITDEMFDYRERLFEQSIRHVGLPEHLIRRWLDMQEQTRSMMVKAKPWPKIIDGEALSLGALETITAPLAMLCDRCGSEVEVGETVRYHSRLGETYCQRC